MLSMLFASLYNIVLNLIKNIEKINKYNPEPYYYLGNYYYKRELYRKALKNFIIPKRAKNKKGTGILHKKTGLKKYVKISPYQIMSTIDKFDRQRKRKLHVFWNNYIKIDEIS